jgi:hypothetical protein
MRAQPRPLEGQLRPFPTTRILRSGFWITVDSAFVAALVHEGLTPKDVELLALACWRSGLSIAEFMNLAIEMETNR